VNLSIHTRYRNSPVQNPLLDSSLDLHTTTIMKTTSILISALAAVATAIPDFQIGGDRIVRLDNSAQFSQLSSEYLSAVSTYLTSKTAQPEWTSAQSALSEFQATASGVPKAVTATDTIMKFATTPAW
jgi:hypothetical protein